MSEAAKADHDHHGGLPPLHGGLPPLHGGALVLLTVGVALSTFMEVLDITIVNVSVPHIAGSLAVSPQEGTWAISSYALASAIMQPLTGWLSKRFGEVRTFATSVSLFVLFSMLCGLSVSMPMLIVCRLLQGAVSGPMVPLSQTLLLNNYPNEKKGLALALWAMTVVIAPIFGPIMGGWLTDNFSWPWIFFINIPVGVFAAIIVWSLLHKRETKTQKVPIDAIGLGLLILGVGALQFMLDNGNDKDWFASPLIITLGIVALVSLSFLVVWELVDNKHPVIDLSLFRKRNFAMGVLALSLGMMGFFGINVVYPLWLQIAKGYTATWAGLATAPVGILAFVVSPFIGRNIQRLNLRIVASFAFLVFAFTAFWFAHFTTDASFSELIWPRVVQGIGIACFFIPINQILLSGLKPNELANASGLSNFCRTIAGSISTAVTVTLWQHRSEYHHAILAENVRAGSASTMQYLDALSRLHLPALPGYAAIEQIVQRESLTLAVNDVFWLFGVMFLVIIVAVWFTRPPFGNVAADAMH